MKEKRLFVGLIQPGVLSKTSFTPGGFIYFKGDATASDSILVRVFLPMADGILRELNLGQYSNRSNAFSIDTILPFPKELYGLDLTGEIYLASRSPITLEVWQVLPLDADEIAPEIINTAAQISPNPLVPNVSMIAVNAVGDTQDPRRGLELVNPPTNTHPVYLGYFHPVGPNNYNYLLNPGATLSVGAWQGELYGYCEQAVTLMGTEFR